jgi:hypothetical protein
MGDSNCPDFGSDEFESDYISEIIYKNWSGEEKEVTFILEPCPDGAIQLVVLRDDGTEVGRTPEIKNRSTHTMKGHGFKIICSGMSKCKYRIVQITKP